MPKPRPRSADPHKSPCSRRGGISMHTARPRSHTRQGFALVELLVVITIVAILFAVTVLAVDAVSGTGKTRTCADDTQTLRAAVEAYRAKHTAPLVTPTEHQLVNAGLLNN